LFRPLFFSRGSLVSGQEQKKNAEKRRSANPSIFLLFFYCGSARYTTERDSSHSRDGLADTSETNDKQDDDHVVSVGGQRDRTEKKKEQKAKKIYRAASTNPHWPLADGIVLIRKKNGAAPANRIVEKKTKDQSSEEPIGDTEIRLKGGYGAGLSGKRTKRRGTDKKNNTNFGTPQHSTVNRRSITDNKPNRGKPIRRIS